MDETTTPDITPGWQERLADLRKLIRECQHKGERPRNKVGIPFCSDCGMHLTSEHLRNLLIEWISNPTKTSAQPPGTIDSEVLGLLDDFEYSIRFDCLGSQGDVGFVSFSEPKDDKLPLQTVREAQSGVTPQKGEPNGI